MNFESYLLEVFDFNFDNFNTIFNLLVFLFVAAYFVAVVWVYIDISKRTRNPFIKFLSVLAVLSLYLFGLIAYLVFRPHLTIKEKELYLASNRRDDLILLEPGLKFCKWCKFLNRSENKFCTRCGKEIKLPCNSCEQDLDPTWEFCPKCGEDTKPKIEHTGRFSMIRKLTNRGISSKILQNFRKSLKGIRITFE